MQGNLIRAPAEFDVTFNFAIYISCAAKTTIAKLNVAKSPKMFFADSNYLHSQFKF